MTQHLTHGGLPDGMTRWQFFGLIEQARRQIGLSTGAIAYLKVAISNTMDGFLFKGDVIGFMLLAGLAAIPFAIAAGIFVVSEGREKWYR